MRCRKCHKIYDDTDTCPICDKTNSLNDTLSDKDFVEDIELIKKMERVLSNEDKLKPTKQKLRSNSKVSLDKTIALNLDNGGSLLDDINNQIEEVNKSVKENTGEEILGLKNDSDHIKKKRNVLLVTISVSLLLFGFIVFLLSILNDTSNNSRVDVSFEEKLNVSINYYFQEKELDNLIYLLEDSKKDSDKVLKIQTTTKEECEKLLLKYEQEEANSQKEYDDIAYSYRELIDSLYRYALVRNDNVYIRALSENDYDQLLVKFDDIYNSGIDFYEALDLYNEKDYNRSYYMFSKIERDNPYYEESVNYINKIYTNIIHLLNVDILKLEQDIDSLSDKDKLDLYVVIEETILEYDNVYVLDLSDNEEYQKLLNIYTSKVSEYTDIVYKK